MLTARDVARMQAQIATSQPPSCEMAFLTAWPTLRSRARRFGPGLLAVAVDTDGVAALLGVWARPDRPVSAIVGRHTSADLRLAGDERLSLRHLALLVLPRPADGPIRFRVLDLRTPTGFLDEHQRPVEALHADGPIATVLGRYVVWMLPVDGRQDWPEAPQEAWEALPPRRYIDAPDPTLPPPPRADDTLVQVVQGPRYADAGAGSPQRLGLLRVASQAGAAAFKISAIAARRGLLLGRYDRCDNTALRVLDNGNISRVHLIIVEVDGQLYAVDAVSTNGVRRDGEAFRELRLGRAATLELGYGLAEVEWSAG